MGTQRQPTPQPGPDEKTLAGGGAREFGERLRREGGSRTRCPPQPFLPRHSDVLSCPPDKAKPHPCSQGGTWETKAPAAGRGGGHPTGTQPCHSLRARGEHPWGGCACRPPGRVCRAGALGRDECPKEPSTGWHHSHCSHTRGNDQYLGGRSHGENIAGGARKTSPTPKDIHRATADEEREHPSSRRIPCNPTRPRALPCSLHHPPNFPSNQTSPCTARLQRVRVHVFSTQSLNEVFAENLQFPHGLNLAKIAFLTLLGFNSNKPPLYYGTRSHCLDTARKSFIGRENREGKKRKKGREGGGRKATQTNRSCSLQLGDFLKQQKPAAAQPQGCEERGAFPQRRRTPQLPELFLVRLHLPRTLPPSAA